MLEMETWSIQSAGCQTRLHGLLRQHRSVPAGTAGIGTSAPASQGHSLRTQRKKSSSAEDVALVRLSRTLTILRRMAKQDEVLATLQSLHVAVPQSSQRDGSGTVALLQPPQEPPLRAVERIFRSSIRAWAAAGAIVNAEANDVSHSNAGDHGRVVVATPSDDVEVRRVESLIHSGLTVDLSSVHLELVHLAVVVDFIEVACGAPPKAWGLDAFPKARVFSGCADDAVSSSHTSSELLKRTPPGLPLRGLVLTSLSTPAHASGTVLKHLIHLLSRCPTLVLLHLDEACALSDDHCAALQAALFQNLETLRAQLRRSDRCRERRERKEERRCADDVMDFFFWENSDRCAVYELESRLRREIKTACRDKARVTLRKAQEAFTRKRLAAERQAFLEHASAVMSDFYSQSLSGLIFCYLRMIQAAESKSRVAIIGLMSTELDAILVAKKSSQHRAAEKMRNAASAKRDAMMIIYGDERRGRSRIAGQRTAFTFAALFSLHSQRLRNAGSSSVGLRELFHQLFIGPLLSWWFSSPTAITGVSGCTADEENAEFCASFAQFPSSGPASARRGDSFLLKHATSSSASHSSPKHALNRVDDVATALLNASKLQRSLAASPLSASGRSSASPTSARRDAVPESSQPVEGQNGIADPSTSVSAEFTLCDELADNGGNNVEVAAALPEDCGDVGNMTAHDEDLAAPGNVDPGSDEALCM